MTEVTSSGPAATPRILPMQAESGLAAAGFASSRMGKGAVSPPTSHEMPVAGTARTRTDDVPRQWLPTSPNGAPSTHLGTVLVADPGGALGEVLRPALIQYSGCRIVHAGSVSEVLELVDRGLVGELAMVSVRFQGNTPMMIRKLRGAGWPRVLALTTASMPVAPVIEAVRAGASGVLSVAGVIESDPDENNPSRLLSPRELEVVRLVADGWSNKAIAGQLSLSALTVKNHLARIGRKFGVGDRAHIVAIACRGGVIPNSLRQPRRPDQFPG